MDLITELKDCRREYLEIETEERVAYMGDTRMKYGGVPRGGD